MELLFLLHLGLKIVKFVEVRSPLVLINIRLFIDLMHLVVLLSRVFAVQDDITGRLGSELLEAVHHSCSVGRDGLLNGRLTSMVLDAEVGAVGD